MMVGRVLCGGLLMCSMIANAANWVPIGSANGGNPVVTVGVDTIVKVGPLVKFWVNLNYNETQQVVYAYPARYYRNAKYLLYVSCGSRTMATKQGDYYDVDGGGIVYSFSNPVARLNFDDVVPGSLGESELDFACRVQSHLQHSKSHRKSVKHVI